MIREERKIRTYVYKKLLRVEFSILFLMFNVVVISKCRNNMYDCKRVNKKIFTFIKNITLKIFFYKRLLYNYFCYFLFIIIYDYRLINP